MTGKIHSIQSLAATDGPGVRFAVFLQGCPLRCGCCHNPDTWDLDGGVEYAPQEILQKATRCREYFGKNGGITVSGGEPLLQPDFVRELFSLCRAEGIDVCLDTSGCILNEKVLALLEETDRVLLDVKYVKDSLYREYVGCGLDAPLRFLSVLEERKIPTTLRQVVIPSLNDDAESALALRELARKHRCVEKTELLPFRKLCQVKYDAMGIPFRFARFPEPTPEKMAELSQILK